MNITLKPPEERLIQEKLKSGQYATVYEVIVEALRLLEERDKQSEKWVEETREKVAVGIAQLDRGEGLDGEAVVAGILERFKQARQNREINE